MIPLRDINPTERRPVVTWALIALNVALVVTELLVDAGTKHEWIERFGVVPSVLTQTDLLVPRSEGGGLGALITPFTSMFLHGSALHALANVWFLYIFGDNVEDALGRVRFVFFYLACGAFAAIAHVATGPDDFVPMIGGSGAVSGVLAAYVVLFPKARVLTMVIIFVELPAFLFVFVWFGLQVVSALLSMGGLGGGVAWFAHVGGFLVGLVLVFAMRPRDDRSSGPASPADPA